jgi:hypothetical protein
MLFDGSIKEHNVDGHVCVCVCVCVYNRVASHKALHLKS